MNAREELHQLVATTATVLRRGFVVGVVSAVGLGAFVFAVLGLLAFVGGPRGAGWPLVAPFFVLGLIFAPGVPLAALIASFTIAAERRPGFREVARLAFTRAFEVSCIMVFAAVPLSAVAGGLLAIGAGFQSASGATAVLASLLGAMFVLGGVWVFARWSLLFTVATFLEDGSQGDAFGKFEMRLWGCGGLVWAVGAVPLVLALALAGHWLVPVARIPGWLEPAILVAGIGATVVLSFAVATAAYVVAGRGALTSPMTSPRTHE